MKPLSQQLADLSVHANKAEDDATAACTEARATIQARVDKLQADSTKRVSKMDTAAAAKDAAVVQWTSLQRQIKTDHDRIRADIAANKAEHDKARARRKAERAENYAAAAIAFAYDAIDYADAAVLDAIMARADADART